jgi:hypothetical protein
LVVHQARVESGILTRQSQATHLGEIRASYVRN